MSELPHRTNKHPPPPDVTDGLGLSEEDETPTPDLENTHIPSNFPPDYSDVPSSGVDENGKQKRRYERGGRKKASPRQQHEQKYSSPKTSSSSRPTGIRSFNIRRAESGSARPFGVTVEKAQSQSQSQPQSKEKPKTKKKPVKKEPVRPVEPVEFEQYPISDEHEQQVGEYEVEDVDDEEEEEEVRPQEPKEETRRPFAIRLDLNLEIEIFLKAKITGDVTITFLE